MSGKMDRLLDNRKSGHAIWSLMVGRFMVLCLLIGLPAAAMSRAVAKTDEQRHLNILEVHSYSEFYPWTRGQSEAFYGEVLEKLKYNVQINTEYLLTKQRNYSENYAQKYSEYIKEKYKNIRPDAIYVTDDNAFLFAERYLSKLYPGAPVFFSGVNNYDVLKTIDRERITGVFERKDIIKNIKFLKSLKSGIKKINIIGDGSATYKAIYETINPALISNNMVSDINFIVSDRISSIVRKLKKTKQYPVILTTLGAIKDDKGRTLSLSKSIQQIVDATDGLVDSTEDTYIQHGVLGGYVTSSKRQGSEAAKLLLKWYRGVPMNKIEPISLSPNEYIISEAAMDKAGLSIPRIYMGKTRIIDKVPGFMQRHQSLFLTVVVLLSGLLMFSVFLLVINRDEYDQ